MARVAVVTSSPPFVEGGHLVIARELVAAFERSGHDAALITTPQNRFGRQASGYLANWLTDVGEDAEGRAIDRVVSLRYPAYAVRHDSHVCWLNHRIREYYDLWERFSATLSARARIKESVRRWMFHGVDRYLLTRNVRTLYAQSRTIQQRLARWGGIPSEVMYPPPPVRAYRCDDYGEYLFMVGRLTALKRVDLTLRALAEPVAQDIRCVIAGEGEERGALLKLWRQLDLGDRVQFTGRLDEPTLLAHLGRCRAVLFPAFNEDFGFVTVEAFSSGKAVIVCRDGGGAAELVRDGVNGLIVDPTPAAYAAAMRRVMDDRTLAIRLGEAGLADARAMRWDAVVEKLLI